MGARQLRPVLRHCPMRGPLARGDSCEERAHSDRHRPLVNHGDTAPLMPELPQRGSACSSRTTSSTTATTDILLHRGEIAALLTRYLIFTISRQLHRCSVHIQVTRSHLNRQPANRPIGFVSSIDGNQGAFCTLPEPMSRMLLILLYQSWSARPGHMDSP